MRRLDQVQYEKRSHSSTRKRRKSPAGWPRSVIGVAPSSMATAAIQGERLTGRGRAGTPGTIMGAPRARTRPFVKHVAAVLSLVTAFGCGTVWPRVARRPPGPSVQAGVDPEALDR